MKMSEPRAYVTRTTHEDKTHLIKHDGVRFVMEVPPDTQIAQVGGDRLLVCSPTEEPIIVELGEQGVTFLAIDPNPST